MLVYLSIIRLKRIVTPSDLGKAEDLTKEMPYKTFRNEKLLTGREMHSYRGVAPGRAERNQYI